MTFFGGVGGRSVGGNTPGGGEGCGGGGEASPLGPSVRWFESISSTVADSTRSGCKRYRRRSRELEKLPTSPDDSSLLMSLFKFVVAGGGDAGGDLDRLAKGERERSRASRSTDDRKRSGSSSASSPETLLLLLFPMMLSIVKPEPLAPPPAVVGDLLLTAGCSVAATDAAVGLGDLSPPSLPDTGKGGKSGGSQ